MSDQTSGDIWGEYGRQREINGFDAALAILYGWAQGTKTTSTNQLFSPTIRRNAKVGLVEASAHVRGAPPPTRIPGQGR